MKVKGKITQNIKKSYLLSKGKTLSFFRETSSFFGETSSFFGETSSFFGETSSSIDNIMLCHVVSCHIVLFDIVSCHIMLQHVMSSAVLASRESRRLELASFIVFVEMSFIFDLLDLFV